MRARVYRPTIGRWVSRDPLFSGRAGWIAASAPEAVARTACGRLRRWTERSAEYSELRWGRVEASYCRQRGAQGYRTGPGIVHAGSAKWPTAAVWPDASESLYAYAQNRPLVAFDPSGLHSDQACFDECAAHYRSDLVECGKRFNRCRKWCIASLLGYWLCVYLICQPLFDVCTGKAVADYESCAICCIDETQHCHPHGRQPCVR